jgi:hypothetical protein
MDFETTEYLERMVEREEAISTFRKGAPSVFDGVRQYLNTYHLYQHLFGKIPNRISCANNDTNSIVRKIETEYADRIIDKHYIRFTVEEKAKYKYSNVVFVMIDEILIEVEFTGEIRILFTTEFEEKAFLYEKQFRQKLKRIKEKRIHMLSMGQFGTDLLPLTVKKPKVDLKLHYNDDFADVHAHLLSVLKKKDESGLVLLHGKPGTGKSTYIQYLINCLKKKVIFLPPAVAGELDSPGMTSLLVDNKDAIFIIEDAEQLIKSRELTHHSKLSMLLNLTDGILGECLGTVVICTFNTDLGNIDEALLRKGRLIASYKFEELTGEKVLNLKKHLGLTDMELNESMVLSDFFNTQENQFGNAKRKRVGIGF